MVSRIAVASRSRFDILQQDEIEQSDPEDDTNAEIESAAAVIESDMMCAPFPFHTDAVSLIIRSFSRGTLMKTTQTQADGVRMTKEDDKRTGGIASKAEGVRSVRNQSVQRITLEAPPTGAQTDNASKPDSNTAAVPSTRSPVT